MSKCTSTELPDLGARSDAAISHSESKQRRFAGGVETTVGDWLFHCTGRVGVLRRLELVEEVADVGGQQVRDLQSGEVPAAVELGPVHDVVGQLGETPDGRRDLPGKTATPVGAVEGAGWPREPDRTAS